MGRAVKALIALVVAGMLALSGCSGQNPNIAATVDGVAIPVTEAEETYTALKTYLQNPSLAAATGLLVTSRVGASIAQQQGLQFSDDDRAAASASTLPQELAADQSLSGFVNDYVTTVLVSQQLGQEAFLAAAAAVEVEVNPRFGSWDAATLQLEPGSGSLSSPAPATAG
jgi:hypothetical protein